MTERRPPILPLALALLLTASGAASAQPAPDFDALMDPQRALQDPILLTPARPWADPAPPGGAAVEVPLPLFDALWRTHLDAASAASTGRLGPAVVLGAADYRGEARGGALHLEVTLSLTLGRPGAWKTVPLVGEGAVLVEARVDGEPIGVATSHGYHVWLTQRTGEVAVALEILVPPTGPRGSIEYDLVVPRTPATRFTCAFPGAGLEPRVDDAVKSDVTTDAERTTLAATLRPTTRIHLVGYRDLGDSAETPARVYAEGLHLLSVDDGALELFSEITYTILHAPTKRFEVLVPPGLEVVSADGHGAFRYELEARADGTLIHGETAVPIRDRYALSLRLRRELDVAGERLVVPLPQSLGVERDAAWLAVEVPGKLQLEEAARGAGVTAIDTRQLPPALVRSAVSPILRAYRLATAQARLELGVTRLPERDIASESIDRATAETVVTADGATLTELRLTLRNRLRPGLALTLPAGAEVRSVLLDGAPTQPSRDEAGRLLLPLKRSTGSAAALVPIVLQLVYAQRQDPFGLLGRRSLALPALELPVATVDWQIHLPNDHRYGAFDGDVDDVWTEGRWTPPAQTAPSAAPDAAEQAPTAADALEDEAVGVESAETGAMPVRITLPSAGTTIHYHRFWVAALTPVETRFSHVAAALPLAVAALALALLLLGAFLAARPAASRRGLARRAAGALLALAGAAGVAFAGGTAATLVGLAAAAILVLARRGTLGASLRAARTWAATLPARHRARPHDLTRTSAWRVAWRLALTAALLVVGLALLDDALALAAALW